MRSMDRRRFARWITVSGFLSPFVLTGCHGAGSSALRDEEAGDEGEMITMYDIVMEGWSTLGSGFLGDNGVLEATMIRDNKKVTLDYIQDPHGHQFTLTPEDLAKLRHGEIVEILTTEALDHYHMVRIDPTRIAPGSEAVEMLLDPPPPLAPEPPIDDPEPPT